MATTDRKTKIHAFVLYFDTFFTPSGEPIPEGTEVHIVREGDPILAEVWQVGGKRRVSRRMSSVDPSKKPKPKITSFSTGPLSTPTHWKQTLFLLRDPIVVHEGLSPVLCSMQMKLIFSHRSRSFRNRRPWYFHLQEVTGQLQRVGCGNTLYRQERRRRAKRGHRPGLQSPVGWPEKRGVLHGEIFNVSIILIYNKILYPSANKQVLGQVCSFPFRVWRLVRIAESLSCTEGECFRIGSQVAEV